MISWIKIEANLPTKPELLKLSLRLGVSRREAMAMCIEFWIWADHHADGDGVMHGADDDAIDALVSRPGFAEAMRAVGWLLEHGDGAAIPNWSKHNARSTKTRLAAAKRQADRRWKHKDWL